MTLKDKIVEAAYELFGEKGYDKTSVAEIIQRAGASKGGFYHHFKSKEEILETITNNYIKMVRSHYDQILNDDSMPVHTKFVESFYRVNRMKVESVKDWDKIKNLYTFKDNHLLLRRMAENFEAETAAYYYNLITFGIKKGVFHVDYPKELAALWAREVIKFQQMARGVLLDHDKGEEGFYRMLRFNEKLINHQLGLTSNVIELEPMGKEYLETMRQEMKGKVY